MESLLKKGIELISTLDTMRNGRKLFFFPFLFFEEFAYDATGKKASESGRLILKIISEKVPLKRVIAETIARAMQPLCILNRKFKGERISRKIDNRFWLTVVHLDLTFGRRRLFSFAVLRTSNVSARISSTTQNNSVKLLSIDPNVSSFSLYRISSYIVDDSRIFTTVYIFIFYIFIVYIFIFCFNLE